MFENCYTIILLLFSLIFWDTHTHTHTCTRTHTHKCSQTYTCKHNFTASDNDCWERGISQNLCQGDCSAIISLFATLHTSADHQPKFSSRVYLAVAVLKGMFWTHTLFQRMDTLFHIKGRTFVEAWTAEGNRGNKNRIDRMLITGPIMFL